MKEGEISEMKARFCRILAKLEPEKRDEETAYFQSAQRELSTPSSLTHHETADSKEDLVNLNLHGCFGQPRMKNSRSQQAFRRGLVQTPSV
jgi:hypothetical protein